MSDEDGIARLRRRIDNLDAELIRILNERARCVLDIGAIKRALGRPVYDPQREKEIVEQALRDNPGPLESEALRRLFERLLDESRRLERLDAEEQRKEKDRS